MAGSKGYQNYRHQADVFNIYSILRRRNFPKENIITLAYDDIVNSRRNPFPGRVFSDASHKNVYPGRENIDYVGKEASAANFIRVLTGDSRNGRALQSTEEDDVFIYYDDHGAPGLLCVPANNGPEIYADNIANTIKEMKAKKMFKRLFFVIEACYSGSVGFNITVPGVYVITAAGPQQSSYSAEWDEDLQTFRTNEFTKNFLKYVQENPDAKIIDSVNYASSTTTHSHVQAFGDFKVATQPLSRFLLSEEPVIVENGQTGSETNELVENGASNSNAFLNFLERRLAAAKTADDKNVLKLALDNEIKRREKANKIFHTIERRMIPNGIPEGTPFVKDIKYDCYRAAIEGFRLFCGEIDENELAKVQIFTHLCEKGTKEEILEDIRQTCPNLQWNEEQLYF
jgi:legumain